MYEIVIVRSCYFLKRDEVGPRISEMGKDRLWWFDGPFELPGQVMVPAKDGLFTMECEAAWFQFEFVPNLRELEHFQEGSSYLGDEFKNGAGFELFSQDLPQLVEIARRKNAEDEYCPQMDFFVLYDVDVNEYYVDDGHLDEIEAVPTLLGELDISKLVNALVTPEGNK